MTILLAITDRRLMGADPVRRIEALMDAHRERVIVQIREKDLDARTVHRWVEALMPALVRTGARLLVNERVDVVMGFAPLVGVHLPERALPVHEVRRLLPERTLIGASAHSIESALMRMQEGANLVTLSPVFETPSKPGGAPLGLEPLRELVHRAQRRAMVFALGGIDRPRAQEVLATGVDGFAAIRSAWLERWDD
jgi:thiamine-phosphate pyrophosphorylase